MYYHIRKNIKFLKWLGTIIKQCLLHILIFGIIKLQKHKYFFQIIADGYQDLALYLSQQCLLYLRSVNLGECWLTKLVNERDMIALHACSKIGIFYNVKHSYCLACWHFCLFFFMGGWYDWNNFCFLWRFSFTVTWFSYNCSKVSRIIYLFYVIMPMSSISNDNSSIMRSWFQDPLGICVHIYWLKKKKEKKKDYLGEIVLVHNAHNCHISL